MLLEKLTDESAPDVPKVDIGRMLSRAMDDAIRVAIAEADELEKAREEGDRKPIFTKTVEWPG